MEKTKIYTVKLTKTKTGYHLNRTNDGFTPLELLGICDLISDELRGILQGNKSIKIDLIERNSIVDNPLADKAK